MGVSRGHGSSRLASPFCPVAGVPRRVGCRGYGSEVASRPDLLAHDIGLGARWVAGADEAGRGCLAGPIVGAAVCLDLVGLRAEGRDALAGLRDSKALTARRRAALFTVVVRHAAQVTVIAASSRAIDRDGLHATNIRVLRDALAALDPLPEVCLVDGFRLGEDAPPHRAVVKGDATSAAIAAASIVAKETRDRLMRGPVAGAYPGYGFERHVGYITAVHSQAVRDLGPSAIHRLSFRSSAYGDHPTLFG